MTRRIQVRLFTSLIITLLGLLGPGSVQAQDGGGWSSPIRLSEGILDDAGAPARMLRPSTAADPWGVVHVVWPVQIQEQTAQIGDTLYYARWSPDTGWSDPLDVLYLAPDHVMEPRVAADNQGWLHVVWTGIGHIGYSRAPTMTALESARSWHPEVQIAAAKPTQAAIAIDSTGNIHVVFCDGSDEVSVKYSNSSDGMTWTDPETVASGVRICQVDIAVDDRDQLHLVFGLGEVGGKAVHYTRSEDSGRTWLSPIEIDRKDARFWELYAPEAITVLPANDGLVHLVWFGAPAAHRWHQWSQDYGQTWSRAVQLSPDLRLSTSPPGLAIDGLGRLHLVSLGGGEAPFGLYHAVWDNGNWSPLVRIVDSGDEMTDIAITQGNFLHVVWDKMADGDFSIWATDAMTDAPTAPAKPMPTVVRITSSQSSSGTQAPSAPVAEAQSAVDEALRDQDTSLRTEPAPNEGNTLMPMLLGAMSSGLIIIIVVMVMGRRQVR
ncbi:MAG: exo-alpha-sialidase [Anaerolineae bacterium]|nr:exo-alpha-sialidase [Anaerolineae bacterium]